MTILGLFNLAGAMFVGFGGLYAAVSQDDRVPVQYLGRAIAAGLTLQLFTTVIAWSRAEPSPPIRSLNRADSAWAIRWGAGTLVLLAVVEATGRLASLNTWVEGAAVSATAVLAVGILWRPDSRLLSMSSMMLIAAFSAYALVFHSGSGRLRIIALASAILLLVSARLQHRAIKVAVIGTAPLALFVLAQQRLSLQESIQAGGSAGRNGLESMLIPIVVFGRLLEEQDLGLPLTWGASFLAFPLAFLPASWFPGAPQPFGYELVNFYSPGQAGTGFSLAATVGAEAVYNFALPGIVVVAIALAFFLSFMDGRFVAAVARVGSDRPAVVGLALWSVVGGAIADLAWNGQHVYLTRTVTRLPALVMLGMVAALGPGARNAS